MLITHNTVNSMIISSKILQSSSIHAHYNEPINVDKTPTVPNTSNLAMCLFFKTKSTNETIMDNNHSKENSVTGGGAEDGTSSDRSNDNHKVAKKLYLNVDLVRPFLPI